MCVPVSVCVCVSMSMLCVSSVGFVLFPLSFVKYIDIYMYINIHTNGGIRR